MGLPADHLPRHDCFVAGDAPQTLQWGAFRMRRSHRNWHALIWRVLGPVILIAAYFGLQAKQTTPIEEQTPGKIESATLPGADGETP